MPHPKNSQGKAGQGYDQPDLVDVPGNCREGCARRFVKAPSNPNYSMVLYLT